MNTYKLQVIWVFPTLSLNTALLQWKTYANWKKSTHKNLHLFEEAEGIGLQGCFFFNDK